MRIILNKEQLRDAANSWLSEPGLKWNQIACHIDPKLTGNTLSRSCMAAGMIPVPAREFYRCHECKSVKLVSEFTKANTRVGHSRNCNPCRARFTQERVKREKENNLPGGGVKWDAVTSNRCSKLWTDATKGIKR